MKLCLFVLLFISPFVSSTQAKRVAEQNRYLPVQKVATEFKSMLQRPNGNFKPFFETIRTDSVVIEKGYFYSEPTEKVPVIICKPAKTASKSFPVVICLHGTGGSKEDASIKEVLFSLAKIGIMGVAIDARYHGERVEGGANNSEQYVAAITSAWKNMNPDKQEHPFFYDTVYDLWRLTDYLVTRPDVQPARIGMMGISMGGIETWMAASVDTRIKVAVPVIAAQSFKWSLENNQWQGRARTIWKVHEEVVKDLGASAVSKENVSLLWAKLIPGITDNFDCPSMIRLFAPRPLLLLNNEKDMNCPLPGAKVAFESATNAYKAKNALNRLMIQVTPDQPHRFLPEHLTATIDWFRRWLRCVAGIV